MFDRTPLHFAVQNSHNNVIEYLIVHGADCSKGIRGESFIHWASQMGFLSVIHYLIIQKADINAKDTDVEFLYLIGHLFIMLLDMVIFVLLNI